MLISAATGERDAACSDGGATTMETKAVKAGAVGGDGEVRRALDS
jgi:hypothetical protein